eukprot:10170506-Alexandrium_andersonii.AAC.1
MSACVSLSCPPPPNTHALDTPDRDAAKPPRSVPSPQSPCIGQAKQHVRGASICAETSALFQHALFFAQRALRGCARAAG